METNRNDVIDDTDDGSDVASNCTEIAQIDDVILEVEDKNGVDDDEDDENDDDDDDDDVSTEKNVERETVSHISSNNPVSSSLPSPLRSPSSSASSSKEYQQKQVGSPGSTALNKTTSQSSPPLQQSLSFSSSSVPSSSSSSSSSTTASSIGSLYCLRSLPYSPPTPATSSSKVNNESIKSIGCVPSAFPESRFGTAPNYFNNHKEYETTTTSNNNNNNINNNKYNSSNSSSIPGHKNNNNNEELMLEVTCGQNSAFLYMSRLQLGSKGTCVYFDGSWLTPNEFQFVSGRETAKDWKRSIKHHGKSLKVLIAKGILTTSPLRCSCGQCSSNNSATVPLVPQQHLFGAAQGVSSLLLQQQQNSSNTSLQVREKSTGMLDSRKYSPCCTSNGSTPTNNLQHSQQQQQYAPSNSAGHNHHHHHHPPIFAHHPSTHHHYPNSHHQVYAGGHTSHHFPKTGNGYFKMADDLMMMKASFLSPSVAAMESPYGAFYVGGACFPMENCRSKQINGTSGGGDEISGCPKGGTSQDETSSGDNDGSRAAPSDCCDANESRSMPMVPSVSTSLSPSSSSSFPTNGGEKERNGNDVRCSVTTRDCGTSFERKHVNGSGKTSCRKSSGSKDEKTACQPSLTGSPSASLQHSPIILPRQADDAGSQQQQQQQLDEQQRSSDRAPVANVGDDNDFGGNDDNDDVIRKSKDRDSSDDNNNNSKKLSSDATKDKESDRHGDKDHHHNSCHNSVMHQDTEHPYFSSLRVSAFNDVAGHLAEPYYSMFQCNYPSPPCYPSVLGGYPPFYPPPYFFPINLSASHPSLLSSSAGTFSFPWPTVSAESSPNYPKSISETSPPLSTTSKSDAATNPSWAASTTTTSSNATPIFNFPWMRPDCASPSNSQIFPSAFEAAKRKFSSLDSSDDKERSLSPPSCKRFHGDANPPPYFSGLGGCWPMTHFYYAPHFEFRSLMVNPFSPCEASTCEGGRGFLGGGAMCAGNSKIDPHANLFPSLYPIPYLHGISTR